MHALDAALRAVLTEAHPHLADTWLTNFKVRILDETKGSDASIRVLIDATDGDDDVGLDRRLDEPHRRVLGGARRLAGVRRAAQPRARRRGAVAAMCALDVADARARRSRSRGRCSARPRRPR